MKKLFFTLLAVGCLTGCFAPLPKYLDLTSEETANADYGAFPQDYSQIIKDFMQTRLKDPYSAVYRIMEPRKCPIRRQEDSSLESIVFYYCVEAYINSKNSYGGYAGESEYGFKIRNGQVLEYWTMDGGFYKEVVQY